MRVSKFLNYDSDVIDFDSIIQAYIGIDKRSLIADCCKTELGIITYSST